MDGNNDDDKTQYTVVLDTLKSPSNKRDPRTVRLAAVAAAMSEVVGGTDVSAAKVYAATISALEGTLTSSSSSSSTTSTGNPVDSNNILSTQVALLELLRQTVPHVANPVIFDASLSLSSRVLRGIVSSCLGMDNNNNNNNNSNNQQQQQKQHTMETKDELGGINAVLRAVCRAVTELLKRLTPKCDAKLVKQFYYGTIMGLFEDHRPKVRKASQNGIIEILFSSSGCNPTVLKATNMYCHNKLNTILKRTKKADQEPQPELLHLLAFLERTIGRMDITMLGTDVMELLVAMLQRTSANAAQSDYVALSKKDSASKIMAINALLSTVKELVESSSELQEEAIDAFCPRVLATLLQNNPSLVFLEGSIDRDLLHRGRLLYGNVILSACQRVMGADPELASKLLPVSIQVVLQLGKSGDEVDEDVAEPLLTELSALLRVNFRQLLLSTCSRTSLDTCIANSLKALEQVMLPTFQSTWSVSLKTLVILLQMVDSHEMVPEMVDTLLDLRDESSYDVNSQRAVETAVGSLIEGVGIEEFWKWVEWTPSSTDPSKKNTSNEAINLDYNWLLPVMKTATGASLGQRPHLEFFQTNILGLARQCASMVAKTKDKDKYDSWVVGLWSLFPIFCQRPVDLVEHIEKLTPTLVKAMEDKRYPHILGLVCAGLETLAVNTKEKIEMEEGTVSEETQREADVMSKTAVLLLPVLFKNVERLHAGPSRTATDEMDVEEEEEAPEQGPVDSNLSQKTCQAIARLASLAPSQFLHKLFKKVMRRLLEASQSESSESDKLCSLLTLSQALVASKALDESSVSLLYRTMKPMIRNDENGSKVQKQSYKVLTEICRCHHTYVSEPETLKELIELLTGSAVTSQVTARSVRLKCMAFLVNGFEDGTLNDADVITKMTGEVLLCLKDSKGKTRDHAYEVLLALAKASGNLTEFLRVIMSALAAETTHMRSAAVMAASRLVFEYAREDTSIQAALPSLLQTVLILFDEQSREVVKSAVGFVRVCVAAMEPDQLRPLLPNVVGSLLKYGKGKDRFRAKIKIILKKLVRLYGYDELMPYVPESETRLLVHMRKLDERAKRRKASNRTDGAPDRFDFNNMVDSDEEDSDDGKTLMTGATGLTKMTAKTKMTMQSAAQSKASKTLGTSLRSKKGQPTGSLKLPSENDGEVVDMLTLKEKNVKFADMDDDDNDSDDGGVMEFDDMGRLVVLDDDDDEGGAGATEEANYDGRDGKRRRLGQHHGGGGDDVDSHKSGKSTKSVKSAKSGKKVRELGAAYKSKKSGGDVRKKGQQFEPYAYVPLDGRSYSKKNRRKAVEQMETVVPHGKKRKH